MDFVERYFPDAAVRGRVEYTDIEGMSAEQADALSYSLARGIRALRKGSETLRASGGEIPLDEDRTVANFYEIKSRLYAIALGDLCAAFRLAIR